MKSVKWSKVKGFVKCGCMFAAELLKQVPAYIGASLVSCAVVSVIINLIFNKIEKMCEEQYQEKGMVKPKKKASPKPRNHTKQIPFRMFANKEWSAYFDQLWSKRRSYLLVKNTPFKAYSKIFYHQDTFGPLRLYHTICLPVSAP